MIKETSVIQRSILFLFLMVFLIFLSGCAKPEIIEECIKGKTYGFFGGLWHGLIAPISFIISLFSDEIAVYAINNTGGWYDFGFLLGIGAFSTGASSGLKKKKKW